MACKFALLAVCYGQSTIMDLNLLIIFLIAFLLPIEYQRFHFLWAERDFMKTPLRTKTGLQIHHGHWGIIWIFIACLLLLFGDKNFFSVGLLGLGWGLLCDEIIPSLKMPSKDRELELEVYKKSAKATLVLAFTVVLGFTLIYILTS